MPDRITIIDVGVGELPVIRDIAYRTWPAAYGGILSKAQLKFMLAKFYSIEALEENLSNKNHKFSIAYESGMPLGFLAYEHNYLGKMTTRIHKLYMLPELQGKGVGKMLLNYAEKMANSSGSNVLSLNVNRFNKAQHFYLKQGFIIVLEEDIEIGNGYLMEDYRMEKPIVK